MQKGWQREGRRQESSELNSSVLAQVEGVGGRANSANEPSLTLSPSSVARNGVISSLENVFEQCR